MQVITQSTNRSVIETIIARQAELNVTDDQLAVAFGQKNASSVALFKQGRLKLPMRHVSSIASTLSLDPAALFRLVLSEYLPDVLETIDALPIPMNLTEDEHNLLSTYREFCEQHRGHLAVINGKAVVALVVA